MRKVAILTFIVMFVLTIQAYALRIQKPRHFTYPMNEADVAELNSILEQLFLMQQGRFELDVVSASKTNANTGEIWVVSPSNSIEYMVGGTVYQVGSGGGGGGLSVVTADAPLSGDGTPASHLIFTNPGYITAAGVPAAETDPTWNAQKGGYITEVEGQVYATNISLGTYIPKVDGVIYLQSVSAYSPGLLGIGTTGNKLSVDNTVYPTHGTITPAKWCTGTSSTELSCTQDTPTGGSGLTYAQTMRLIAIKE